MHQPFWSTVHAYSSFPPLYILTNYSRFAFSTFLWFHKKYCGCYIDYANSLKLQMSILFSISASHLLTIKQSNIPHFFVRLVQKTFRASLEIQCFILVLFNTITAFCWNWKYNRKIRFKKPLEYLSLHIINWIQNS